MISEILLYNPIMSRSASEVSVITVNWNGRQHLSYLIPSLIQLRPKEIIVVDNGSEDDSVLFLTNQYPQVKIIQNSLNKGFAEPNNLAAKSARGAFLAFINNDMRADPQWLSAALARTDSHRVVGSRILDWEGKRVDFNGSSLQYLGYAVQKDIGELVAQVSHQDEILFPCGGAMLIDRKLFLEMGGFDEDYFAVFEDVDLGWRLWLCGHRIAFAPESVVYHRGHSTLASRGTAKMRYLMHRNALLTIIKNYEEETIRRILPLAFVMAVKRAVRCSGVRKESFYFWSDIQSEKVDSESMQDALNHLVAVEDVLDCLPETLGKREQVQAHRELSDSDILSLFEDPLRPIVEEPEYIAKEIEYLQLLGLDGLFEIDSYRKLTSGLDQTLKIRVADLRRELAGMQWQSMQTSAHPNPEHRNRLTKFVQLCRTLGFKEAVGHSVKKIRRGF